MKTKIGGYHTCMGKGCGIKIGVEDKNEPLKRCYYCGYDLCSKCVVFQFNKHKI